MYLRYCPLSLALCFVITVFVLKKGSSTYPDNVFKVLTNEKNLKIVSMLNFVEITTKVIYLKFYYTVCD